ncbi:MAG: MarR family transcriptional regulator [Micromonosporaceae bacterium]|nr:MarR family transcriptional regulator [Micromonosporaceae bacterium]
MSESGAYQVLAEDAEQIHELFMDLIRVTGVLQPEQVLPGHTLTLSQAFALHELDSEVPLSQQDLADRLKLDKSSVSRMAAELERKGLLVRERDEANRRLYRLRLTGHGRSAHARMATGFHHRFEQLVAAMDRADRTALRNGLAALIRVARSGAAR